MSIVINEKKKLTDLVDSVLNTSNLVKLIPA